jgi:hypothetical protein
MATTTLLPVSISKRVKLSTEDKIMATRSTNSREQCFSNIKEWVEANDGFVHEALSLTKAASASALANDADQEEDGDCDREITATQAISKDTVLLKIPIQACCITLESIEEEFEESNKSKSSSDTNKHLFQVMEGIPEKDLFHSKSDILLALFLCRLYSKQQESTNTNENNTNNSSGLRNTYLSYLQTLPLNESYNNLPRRWDSEDLTGLLAGTSLRTRVQKEQTGLKSDYEKIVDSWTTKNANEESSTNAHQSPPAYDLFDQCIATVSSRCFGELGGREKDASPSLDAMVPILDLLNHKRGSNETADVCYQRQVQVSGNVKDAKKGADMYVVVTARSAIPQGMPIRNTYGAKGNAQLLNRYGFCIPNNIEPDGSCNDVLEFEIPHSNDKEGTGGAKVVDLRAGPKSYTFGGLVKALEHFHDHHENVNGDTSTAGLTSGGKESSGAFGMDEFEEDDEEDDDMDAFLNACDEEEDDEEDMGEEDEDDDDDDDDEDAFMFSSGMETMAAPLRNKSNDKEASTKAEVSALQRLRQALNSKSSSYSLNGAKLAAAMQLEDGSKEYYAALLVSSEKRTIEMYVQAIERLVAALSNKDGHHTAGRGRDSAKQQPPISTRENGKSNNEDDCLVTRQATDLVSAYMAIRHP